MGGCLGALSEDSDAMWLPWRNRCPLDRLREFALVCRTTLRSELGDEAFELQYALGAEPSASPRE
ncbi:MAG TPA: hypothetical protein VMU68_07240 [Acidimicrobiales bacterium]|nr:hypothetical protein [Acidimicrobiales bacterium]